MTFRLDRETLIWALVVPHVLIDSVNGFLSLRAGVDVPLSMLSKALLMLLLCWHLLVWRPVIAVPLLVAATFLFMNPVIQFLFGGVPAASYDLVVAGRLLLLLLMVVFAFSSVRADPSRFDANARRTLAFSFWVVVINVASGFVGLGFNTYQNLAVGFKGYFIAGNELSALWIVVASFVLFEHWKEGSRLLYWLLAFLVGVISLSIATKSTLAFSVIGLAIPTVCAVDVRTATKRLLGTTVAIAVVAAASAAVLWERIVAFSVLERGEFVFDRFGLAALLFSGRDQRVQQFLSSIHDTDGAYPLLFGYGSTRLAGFQENFTTEIDPIDIAMLFGVPVAGMCIALGVLSLLLPLRSLATNRYALVILIVNLLLFVFALLAGHVWTSGLLAICWAVMNGYLWRREQRFVAWYVPGRRAFPERALT